VKLVILDRDGVINQDSDQHIKSPQEWHAIAGSLAAVSRLNHAGFTVAIATNQSGLARGLFSIDDLNAIHQKMFHELSQVGAQIAAILFCPHGPDEKCDCRKPSPGLLKEIGRRFRQDLRGVPVIGDSLRDIEAARAVGARPILVLTGKGRATRERHVKKLGDTAVYEDLGAAVDALLEE
jgi:D-glycero-D-manno-heptose 1,7-bisphosphate phosphatase